MRGVPPGRVATPVSAVRPEGSAQPVVAYRVVEVFTDLRGRRVGRGWDSSHILHDLAPRPAARRSAARASARRRSDARLRRFYWRGNPAARQPAVPSATSTVANPWAASWPAPRADRPP